MFVLESYLKMKIILVILTVSILVGTCSGDAPQTDGTTTDVDTTEIVDIDEVADSSTIQCPFCGFEKMEELPTEVCLISYDCDSCGKTIHPEEGDCCVFCSYGDHECPSMEE